MNTCFATAFDLETFHPTLHAVLAEVRNENKRVSVLKDPRNKDLEKYFILAQFRNPATKKQVPTRHGFYLDKELADLLARWLHRQPLSTIAKTGATREFAESLFPPAFFKGDSMIGLDRDIVVEDATNVMRDMTTGDARTLIEGHGLPSRFRVASVNPMQGGMTLRLPSGEDEQMPVPFLASEFPPDYDWSFLKLTPDIELAQAGAQGSIETTELLESLAIAHSSATEGIAVATRQ